MTRELVFERTSLLVMAISVLVTGIAAAGLAEVPDFARLAALAIAAGAWLVYRWPDPLARALDVERGAARRVAGYWGLWTTAQAIALFASDLHGLPGWLLFILGIVIVANGWRTHSPAVGSGNSGE